MPLKFDAKAYRVRYHKERYPKKIKVLNLNRYAEWLDDSKSTYKKFSCRECTTYTECYNFYIGHLRFCLLKQNFSLLLCKGCHNKKKKPLLTKSLGSCKVKSFTGTIPESIKVWLQEEKLKKDIGTPPVIKATLNQPAPNELASADLNPSTPLMSPSTLSEAAPPRALGQ
jgi:hypothetical protein